MTRKHNDIRIIQGDTRILLIAPHGKATRPRDDINTDKITAAAAERLNCSAIVNDVFRRKKYNFNSIQSASTHPSFIESVQKVVDSKEHTLVVWVHGAGDEAINKESIRAGCKEEPERLHAVIGYGQGPNSAVKPTDRKKTDKSGRPTASQKTVEQLRDRLTQKGMTTTLTSENALNFRGRSLDNMNQWFVSEGYDFGKVESVQLEIRMTPFRLKSNVDRTAQIIADALSELVPLTPF